MSQTVIQLADGTYRGEPSANIIDTDDGVYVAYDIDATEDDYTFYEDADVVGTLYGDVDDISDPDPDGSWLTDLQENWRE